MVDTGEIAAIAKGLERWADRLGRQFGPLSRPQRRMLAAVATAREQIRVGDLAQGLGLTMPGVTRMIDTLEAAGFVQRLRQPASDQRQVYIALTREGTIALQEANAVFEERVRSTVAGLDAAERATLVLLLSRIDVLAGTAAPAGCTTTEGRLPV